MISADHNFNKLVSLVSWLRTKQERRAMLKKIGEVHGKEFAERAKVEVIKIFKQRSEDRENGTR